MNDWIVVGFSQIYRLTIYPMYVYEGLLTGSINHIHMGTNAWRIIQNIILKIIVFLTVRLWCSIS